MRILLVQISLFISVSLAFFRSLFDSVTHSVELWLECGCVATNCIHCNINTIRFFAKSNQYVRNSCSFFSVCAWFLFVCSCSHFYSFFFQRFITSIVYYLLIRLENESLEYSIQRINMRKKDVK